MNRVLWVTGSSGTTTSTKEPLQNGQKHTMKKTFVLDTNVMLTDPQSIFMFEDNDVVIPISVIEELDKFKKDMSETGRHAREFSRILDRLRDKGSLCSGVLLHEDRVDSGILYVYLDKEPLPPTLSDTTDNHILAIAGTFRDRGHETVLITKDANLRIKADAFGVESQDFECDKIDVSDLYTGVRAIEVEDHELDGFFKKSHRSYDLKANEFIAIEGRTRTLYGRFDAASQKIKRVNIPEDIWGVKPRNDEQFLALAALMDDRIKLVTLSGGAGTGKTLMAIAAGLHKTTDEHVFKKLLVARPIFPMGKDLGFLPGDLSEKLNPWMQPIFDNLELLLGPKHGYEEMINQGILQVEPLTYIRGRSLPNIYFIVDEAQNLTPHEVKTILTRAGENTKIILTGDPDQIDNPYIDATNNGLTYVIEKFKEEAIAAHVQLVKGERSELATIASKLL